MTTQFDRNPRIDADVQLLLGRFRDLLPDGRVISHKEIEETLRMNRKSGRYATVTNKWRRALFQEQRIFLDGRSALGQGFKSLTPDDMIRFSNGRVRSVGKLLRKAIAVASLPHPDEIMNSANRVYQARLLLATEQILSAHKRVLLDLGKALKPAPVLPRASGQ